MNQSEICKHPFMSVCFIWGSVYGALWSFAPCVAFGEGPALHERTLINILLGVLTSIVVAFSLATWITRCRPSVVGLLGLLSLPLGAGFFVFTCAFAHWWLLRLSDPDFPGFDAFEALGYSLVGAYYSMFSMVSLLLIPLAILTTLHLRRKLLRPRQPA